MKKTTTKKQVYALKSLDFSDKIDELKQIDSLFPKNQLNNLIIDKLKEIMQRQNNIKLYDLENTTKRGEHIVLVNFTLRKFVIRRCR